MKVIYIYTNENAPQVDVFPRTSKIEEVTTGDTTMLNITYQPVAGGVTSIAARSPETGKVAILWE